MSFVPKKIVNPNVISVGITNNIENKNSFICTHSLYQKYSGGVLNPSL